MTGARFSFISLFCWPPLSPPRATVSHRPLLFVVFVRSVARSSCSFVCPSTVVVSVERCPCWWQRGRVASLIAVGSRLPAPLPPLILVVVCAFYRRPQERARPPLVVASVVVAALVLCGALAFIGDRWPRRRPRAVVVLYCCVCRPVVCKKSKKLFPSRSGAVWQASVHRRWSRLQVTGTVAVQRGDSVALQYVQRVGSQERERERKRRDCAGPRSGPWRWCLRRVVNRDGSCGRRVGAT